MCHISFILCYRPHKLDEETGHSGKVFFFLLCHAIQYVETYTIQSDDLRKCHKKT